MTQTQTRQAILREEEYVGLLQEASASCGGWVAACLARPERLSRPAVLSLLADTSHALESFLDDHGARQNQTFVLFGELVASLRGLVGVRLRLAQVLSRLARYPSLLPVAALSEELTRAGESIHGAILSLAERLTLEARVLGLSWAPNEGAVADLPVRPRKLPRNLDVDDSVDEREHIAAIGARLVSVLQASRGLELDRVRAPGELAGYVAERATEDRCRWYESAVHNIQSMYDTYVNGTAIEDEYPWLCQVRGHASVSLHLLEMATDLVHFYERHENDLRHEESKQAIAAVVEKNVILDVAVNTCLRNAYVYVEACSELIDKILATFVSQREQVFELPEGLTLHARPLALMVQVARHYGTPMEITIDGESCSASSLMGLIMLAGSHPKASEVRVQGDTRALQDLSLLFQAGLGEFDSQIPASLAYLKLNR